MSSRLSVNVNDETAAALRELAQANETNVTEIIRRATGLYKFVSDQLSDNDKTLQVVDSKTQDRTILTLL